MNTDTVALRLTKPVALLIVPMLVGFFLNLGFALRPFGLWGSTLHGTEYAAETAWLAALGGLILLAIGEAIVRILPQTLRRPAGIGGAVLWMLSCGITTYQAVVIANETPNYVLVSDEHWTLPWAVLAMLGFGLLYGGLLHSSPVRALLLIAVAAPISAMVGGLVPQLGNVGAESAAALHNSNLFTAPAVTLPLVWQTSAWSVQSLCALLGATVFWALVRQRTHLPRAAWWGVATLSIGATCVVAHFRAQALAAVALTEPGLPAHGAGIGMWWELLGCALLLSSIAAAQCASVSAAERAARSAPEPIPAWNRY